MSIKVGLEHRTTYRFARPVTVGPHVVRLRPAPYTRTPIEAYSLDVTPANHFVNWQQDPFGNWLARFVFPEKTDTLEFTVGLVADLVTVNPFDFFVENYAQTYPFSYAEPLAADLAPYLRAVEDSDRAAQWRRDQPDAQAVGVPIVQFLADLNTAVNSDVAYSVRMETGVLSPDETLARGIGSCRDSAWLLVSLLRQHGLAARFVSGYLVQLASDPWETEHLAASELGGAGPTEDFTDLHAWAEVYIPGAGWIGLDATSALFAGEGHIPLSATPHPASAAPIEGATEPVQVEFGYTNSVTRVREDPRVTRPYTDAEWARIDALGEAVDDRLVEGDVRLTMGGEPTFVSRDDMRSAQWTIAADGPEKRTLATTLAERLRATYALGGVVHRGQGKWYPGEELPRWNIALQWRTDGVALWRDPALFADPWADDVVGETAVDVDGATSAEEDQAPARAEALARRITSVLGLPAEQLLAAYEDPFAAVAEEVRRPEGEPDDRDADLTAMAELDRAEDVPTGWVLPLVAGLAPDPVEAPADGTADDTADAADADAAADDGQRPWTSPAWRFRRGRLVLLGGTSAVGLRLPLDSVSWAPPAWAGEPSYVEAGPPLDPQVPSVTVVAAEGARTTAVTVEARGGHVHVFLPPTERLEDYTDLLRLIEVAARRLQTPVVLEGYGPPPDARLTQLVVTPDPGVIELNVQPTHSWAEQRELTTTLYEQARGVGLATEKFDLDGRHTGTGGGNHITLGGHEPAESPLLRRPDLLASLVTYWQRHPALSYLFSGRFIGPTSQAPRFDEGRPEAVYEMEIALGELRRLTAEQETEGLEPRPWLVDRALRHLLTDLTGNTHRAEFCVDKLYSPDSSRGRLGLLELRGFEMPPHPQMALVQSLLVRSLISMFWQQPLIAPLVRWGTALHEDFMLRHGVEADIADVVADLHAAGIDFEESWLDPFTEFRFPRIGAVAVGRRVDEDGEGRDSGIALELHQGIEPWNVLGEEATAGGTARYVDSSVERVQVSVTGLDPDRHLVTCQGVPVPLTPTGRSGEWYAGIRFRAWQPWSALHPSIAVHSPIRVEVIDTASAHSLGGATYHVVHPGGQAWEHPPVNAHEAEARRSVRFEPFGFTAGRLDVAAIRAAGQRAASSEYPHTLDLRRVPGGRL